ncbi:MAG: hypothetical protein P8M05_03385 [Flavobacteriales bacterium]|nr:hypothetical protein [Flavobacteriales bacterium]
MNFTKFMLITAGKTDQLKNVSLFIVLITLTGCLSTKGFDEHMDENRKSFAETATEFNRKIYTQQERENKLYRLADLDIDSCIEFADTILIPDETYGRWDLSSLYMVFGEILYDHDSIQFAYKQFLKSDSLSHGSPRSNANKAGCFLKYRRDSIALMFLDRAVSVNNDFRWLVGNYHEVKRDTSSAIEQYDFLYHRDTSIYRYCQDRIDELKQPETQLYSELMYRNRRQRLYITLGP